MTTPKQSSPHMRLRELTQGFLIMQALYVTAELGIADLLAEGPQTSDELAAATGAHPRSLYRVLRALSSKGVFTEVEPSRFGLTDLGRCLHTGGKGSLRSWFRIHGRLIYPAAGNLLYGVRTGQSAFEQTFGASLFDYLADHPDDSALFNAAMTERSWPMVDATVAAYDFSRFQRIVDVGGGQGVLLTAILQTYPTTTGVLFDLPHVAKEARTAIEQASLAGRCEIAGGDFFDAAPAGGDAYLLAAIIHDWEDDQATRILGNCRQAMVSNGRLLLIERVVPSGDEPDPSKLMDLVMLVGPGGQERTQAEYDTLLANAGFHLSRIVPTSSYANVIEAIPV